MKISKLLKNGFRVFAHRHRKRWYVCKEGYNGVVMVEDNSKNKRENYEYFIAWKSGVTPPHFIGHKKGTVTVRELHNMLEYIPNMCLPLDHPYEVLELPNLDIEEVES